MRTRAWRVPQDARVREVLEWCIGHEGADRLMLSERPATANSRTWRFDARVTATVERLFGDHVIETFGTPSWPGTELVGHSGRVHVVRLDREIVERMAAAEPLLLSWSHAHPSALPEDPCAFRAGAACPALVGVTHESDAWLLSAARPEMPGVELDALEPGDLLIPHAPTFLDRRATVVHVLTQKPKSPPSRPRKGSRTTGS